MSCCSRTEKPVTAPRWITGQVPSPAGDVPRVAARLTGHDRLDAWATRWKIGRNRLRLNPGLYAVGSPSAESPLLATANYKLSFDALRSALEGFDAWILVLDTNGINVWCAAGKGTFGTEELVDRLKATGVDRITRRKTVILPQLGAPGVAAHDVKQQTGFQVIYGPVYARDIPQFLQDGMKASAAMRRVTFNLRQRLTVVPVELVQRFIPACLVMIAGILISSLASQGIPFASTEWPVIAGVVGMNYLAGMVATPALLPWLPGRSFALKGATTGLVTGLILGAVFSVAKLEAIAIALLSTAVCSYLGLMFTGSTPYTSASGVRYELRRAIPLQILAAGTGLILWIVTQLG